MAKRGAGSNSKRQYERGATQMLKASERWDALDEHASLPAEKVARLLNYLRDGEVLCEGTAAFYVQCAKVAIKRVLGPGQEEPIAVAVSSARHLIKERVGIPEPARGASLKLRTPTLSELGDVFSHLRWKYTASRDPLDLILALYIVVMPRIGLRPVEMTWTEWDGNALYTRTAKRLGRPKRYVPTEHWPPVYRAALGLFVRLLPRGLDDAEFESWRGLLASRLARASKWTRTKKRLSLTFARHIAIANWKQAGITPKLIAELAGHAGLKSQHFYASGRSGYGSRYVFLDTVEGVALQESVKSRGGENTVEMSGEVEATSAVDGSLLEHSTSGEGRDVAEVNPISEATFDWDDMPTPKPPEVREPKQDGGRLWQDYIRRKDAEWTGVEDVLARTRKERMGAQPQRGDEAVDPRNDADNSKRWHGKKPT